MERIRAFEVTNKSTITTLVYIQTESGVVIKSDNIPAGQSIVIDLNNYLSKIKDGDTVFLVPQLGRGTTKKSQEFIYRAGALDKAIFEISRTRIQYQLKFIGTKETYDYHDLDDMDNPREINGINYQLYPNDSIAIVLEKSPKYKGEITIPNTITFQRKKYVVTEINRLAFYDCEELTSLTIPASVCFIGDFVIKDCRMLTSLTIQSVIPPKLDSHGFQEFYEKECTLTVPYGCTEFYKRAYYWMEFNRYSTYFDKSLETELNGKISDILDELENKPKN